MGTQGRRADPLGGHQVNDVGTQGRRALIPSMGTQGRAPIFHAGTRGGALIFSVGTQGRALIPSIPLIACAIRRALWASLGRCCGLATVCASPFSYVNRTSE